nr:hypothetical protein [Tanacetum cinerariifolium]
MVSATICLADNQKFNFSKYIINNMVKSLERGVKLYLFPRFLQVFLDKQVEGMAMHKEMYVISSHTKKIFANMRRIGASFSELQELVLDLQEAKDAKAKEIAALRKKVTKLTKWRKARSRGLRRLKRFGSGRRVKSPMEKDGLGAQEDAPKQGRIIKEIDQNAKIALDDETQGRTNDDEMFGVNDLAGEEVVVETTTTIKDNAALTTNKQKIDENVEPVVDDSEELRECIEIVLDDGDEVLIEATPISSRSPTIIDYNIHKEGKKTYFKIIRADGNSQVYQSFEKMFKNFNREDLEVLWAIVKDKFKKEKPVDDMDNILLRTLKTMSEHHVEDTIWNYQQGLAKVDYGVEMAYDLLKIHKKRANGRLYTIVKCLDTSSR